MTSISIEPVAEGLGLGGGDFELFGHAKAKLAFGLEERLLQRRLGHYVNVTSITPTPAGEGKTVVTIGLAMALCRRGASAIATLREPSLAPLFGVKGGGAGAGRSALMPASDINLHFTGDLHAISAAHNLLAAMVDNHVGRGLRPHIDQPWLRRVIDVSDRNLATIRTAVDGRRFGVVRETGFDLTAASEVMAIIALASDLSDLRDRVANMIVGVGADGSPIRAVDMGAVGAMLALLRDAMRPNLVQTSEGTPALVHAGPFANIAHGNSSVIADRTALRLADYVVTESGFAADCGAEKLFDIKCPAAHLTPRVSVLVCTVRALKLHSGRFHVRPGRPLPAALAAPDASALRDGAGNLRAHLEILRRFGMRTVVAINRFASDTNAELELVRELALDAGADAAEISDVYERGSEGAMELARAVTEASTRGSRFASLYEPALPLREKLERLAVEVYGADGVDLSDAADAALGRFEDWGYGQLPVCVAKTQYSLSHDPKLLGRPRGYRFPVREARLSAGAGYVYALAGDVSTMPGLPAAPAALGVDLDADGNVTGLR